MIPLPPLTRGSALLPMPHRGHLRPRHEPRLSLPLSCAAYSHSPARAATSRLGRAAMAVAPRAPTLLLPQCNNGAPPATSLPQSCAITLSKSLAGPHQQLQQQAVPPRPAPPKDKQIESLWQKPNQACGHSRPLVVLRDTDSGDGAAGVTTSPGPCISLQLTGLPRRSQPPAPRAASRRQSPD